MKPSMQVRPQEKILPRFLRPGETWDAVVHRVCSVGGQADQESYRELVANGVLVPAGQILRGAGVPSRVLHNCFVTSNKPGESASEVAARITKWTALGCGVGINLDALFAQARNSGIPTMDVVMAIARSQQGLWEKGVTRTATMITLAVDDPEAPTIAKIIAAIPECRHLNFSVLVDDVKMAAFTQLGEAGEWVGPLASLASVAWLTGNPGLLFTDRIARDHPFEEEILACNPCAEQHLAPAEGCVLASLNLGALCHGNRLDWEGLRHVTRAAVRFLDDVINAAEYPDRDTEYRARERRRIGIGVMGFATALDALDIEYGSDESINLAAELAQLIRAASDDESQALAATRGAFPGIPTTLPLRRNSHLLSIAPTGAIALLWNASNSIEPYFDLKVAKETLEMSYQIRGTRKPKTAHEVSPEAHVNVLAAWQTVVDGGISKTVNLAQEVTVKDICRLFTAAWRSGCKGISVFRAGSRSPAIRTMV